MSCWWHEYYTIDHPCTIIRWARKLSNILTDHTVDVRTVSVFLLLTCLFLFCVFKYPSILLFIIALTRVVLSSPRSADFNLLQRHGSPIIVVWTGTSLPHQTTLTAIAPGKEGSSNADDAAAAVCCTWLRILPKPVRIGNRARTSTS